ncbi:MAG: hypothetical protein ACRC92_15075 [Peptostreptococcaceae bacterium]
MKTKKIIKLVSSVFLVGISICVYSSLFGDPISYIKAKNEINSYIDEKYNGELEIDSVDYNFKMSGYNAIVSQKYDGRYTSYIGYSRFGNINDGYQFEVRMNMEEELKVIIEALISQGTNLTRENLGVESSIEIPEFKYTLDDKYSGKEPIDLQVWLHAPYSYTEQESIVNKNYEDTLYKDKNEFAKGAYEVIKILQSTKYNFRTIEIYSYQDDGNTSYRVKLEKNEKINSLEEVGSKVFTQGSEKEEEVNIK